MCYYWRCLLILLFSSHWTTSFGTEVCDSFPCDCCDDCVKREQWCDKSEDCPDKSDEKYCEESTWWNKDPNKCENSEIHFLCKSGVCIPKRAQCDGHTDCHGGDDEEQCEPSPIADDLTEASGSSEINIDDNEGDDISESDEEDDKSSSESEEKDTTESGEELLFPKRDSPSGEAPTPRPASIFDFKTSSSADTFYSKKRDEMTRGTASTTTESSLLQTATPLARRFNNVTKSTTSYPYLKTLGKRPPLFVNIIPSPSEERPIFFHRHRHRTESRYNHHNARDQLMWDMNLRPYEKHKKVHSPFYFAKNYASVYSTENARYLQGGVTWLLNQRRSTGDWEEDTVRALIALALTNNGFPFGDDNYEVMKRRFMTQLGIDLLKKEESMMNGEEFNINKLSRMINGVLAVCENPRDFHGIDLTEVLRTKIRKNFSNRHYYVNPYVYLTLCLSNSSLSTSEVQNLIKLMKEPTNEMAKDMQSLAIQAFTCHAHQTPFEDPAYRMSLHETLYNAVSNLHQRMSEDGGFGSVYSTALAAQALMSVNASIQWDPRKTLRFLKEQQVDDGSFGDFLATYYVLPVLNGRSLLHLRNIKCDSSDMQPDMGPSELLEFVGQKQYAHYSIYFGSSLVTSHSLKVLVPRGISLLDMMRVAQYQDENFKFALDENTLDVYSMSGVPNDAEQGLFWHLYLKPESDVNTYALNKREQYYGDIRKLFPRSDQHVIFWYHPREDHLLK